MNFLSIFVLIPVLMILALFLSKKRNQILGVMVTGSTLLIGLSIYLVIKYIITRAGGATDPMLFTSTITWYEPLNIHYSVGVDAVSVAMLCLSAIIVFTGTFVSWENEPNKNFSLVLLISIGCFGFYLSDIFTIFV